MRRALLGKDFLRGGHVSLVTLIYFSPAVSQEVQTPRPPRPVLPAGPVLPNGVLVVPASTPVAQLPAGPVLPNGANI